MTLWTIICLSMAITIMAVTALTAILAKPIHAWLYRNRWSVKRWEDL